MAEPALGIDMQAHGLGHVRAEPAAEDGGAGEFVAVVDAAQGRVVAQVVDQVADIVQQGRHHGGGGRTLLFGQLRALQCMLELADGLLAVLVGPGLLQHHEQIVEAVHRRRPQ